MSEQAMIPPDVREGEARGWLDVRDAVRRYMQDYVDYVDGLNLTSFKEEMESMIDDVAYGLIRGEE